MPLKWPETNYQSCMGEIVRLTEKKKFGLIYTGKHLGTTCETISVFATFGNETC